VLDEMTVRDCAAFSSNLFSTLRPCPQMAENHHRGAPPPPSAEAPGWNRRILTDLAIGKQIATKHGGRRYKMKTQLRILALAVIAGGAMFAQTRFSVGIGVGGYNRGYYPPPVYDQYVPECPGPGYTWIEGYWSPQGGRNGWISGYWRRPYVSGYRMAPRYVEPRYYNSYRGNDRGYNRGYDNRRQNRGGQHFNNRGNQRNERRGRGNSNDFRR
jgi:WXXGXW repeat (2 copies)